MADITRWEPFREMMSLRQAMDRLFEDALVRPFSPGGWGEEGALGGLDIDLYEKDDDLVVEAGLPGVKPEDVDISVQNNVLTIRGETGQEQEGTRGRWHQRERRYGSFFRRIQLPAPVQIEKAEAKFDNGVLRLRLPKAEEARERRIPISAGEGPAATREIRTGGEQGARGAGSRASEQTGESRLTGQTSGSRSREPAGGTRTS